MGTVTTNKKNNNGEKKKKLLQYCKTAINACNKHDVAAKNILWEIQIRNIVPEIFKYFEGYFTDIQKWEQ